MTPRHNLATNFTALGSRAGQFDHARQALSKIPGLQFRDGYRGEFSVGSQPAQVHLDPSDAIRIQMSVALPHPATATLTTNGRLPGNVRFARLDTGGALLADTQIDGVLHLATTFQQIRDGFQLALGRKKPAGRERSPFVPLENRQVQEALNQLKWEPDSIVVTDDAWELRPRVDAESVAVALQLDSETGDLCFRRTVLACLPTIETPQALACDDQALRLNAQLRWVRLARRNNQLVCEARLHPGLLQPAWLALTARAVAVACRHAQPPLRVLVDQESVAQTYLHVLCTRRKGGALADSQD